MTTPASARLVTRDLLVLLSAAGRPPSVLNRSLERAKSTYPETPATRPPLAFVRPKLLCTPATASLTCTSASSWSQRVGLQAPTPRWACCGFGLRPGDSAICAGLSCFEAEVFSAVWCMLLRRRQGKTKGLAEHCDPRVLVEEEGSRGGARRAGFEFSALGHKLGPSPLHQRGCSAHKKQKPRPYPLHTHHKTTHIRRPCVHRALHKERISQQLVDTQQTRRKTAAHHSNTSTRCRPLSPSALASRSGPLP